MTIAEIWEAVKGYILGGSLMNILIKILIAVLIWFVSFRVINVLTRRIEKRNEKKKVDKTISKTLVYVLRIGLKVLVIVMLVGFLGFDTSALTALIASFGVCIGLAVNGTVSNLAGGVMILVTRPFRVDDFIEAQGYSGTVDEIRITATKLITPDNKVIYIPNGALANGNIVNYSERDTRRVDLVFSIAYSADFEKAKTLLTEICERHELVLKDKAPFVRMGTQAASSIDINTRVWVNKADYWTVYADIMEEAKRVFDENGIEIPFQQIDVHMR